MSTEVHSRRRDIKIRNDRCGVVNNKGEHGAEITDDVRLMLAAKYIDLYERITSQTFELPENLDTEKRIAENMKNYMSS